MNDQNSKALDTPATATDGIDIGRPVQWMVDPENHDITLGVTYLFSETGERRTVWYTPNKRRAKQLVVVAVPNSADERIKR